MKLIYSCKKCGSNYVVPSMDPDLYLLEKTTRCPNYEVCKTIMKSKKTNSLPKTKIYITAYNLFTASAGLGLPDERQCSPVDVKKVMLGKKVTKIKVGKALQPNRSIISSMTLDDGRTIYFATSTHGATIYRVTNV